MKKCVIDRSSVSLWKGLWFGRLNFLVEWFFWSFCRLFPFLSFKNCQNIRKNFSFKHVEHMWILTLCSKTILSVKHSNSSIFPNLCWSHSLGLVIVNISLLKKRILKVDAISINIRAYSSWRYQYSHWSSSRYLNN